MMRPTDRAVALTGCGLAIGALLPVALYQSHLIPRLPDPSGSLFASERIVSSSAAHPLGVPDSYLGLASYGTTLALLLLADRSPVAKRLLGAKLLADAGLASVNMVRQVVSFGKLCSWCTGTALATALVVWGGRTAITETVQAARRAL